MGRDDSREMVLRSMRRMFYFGIYVAPSSAVAQLVLGDIGNISIRGAKIPIVIIGLVVAVLILIIDASQVDATLRSRGESLTRIYLSLSKEEKKIPHHSHHLLGALLAIIGTSVVTWAIKMLLT